MTGYLMKGSLWSRRPPINTLFSMGNLHLFFITLFSISASLSSSLMVSHRLTPYNRRKRECAGSHSKAASHRIFWRVRVRMLGWSAWKGLTQHGAQVSEHAYPYQLGPQQQCLFWSCCSWQAVNRIDSICSSSGKVKTHSKRRNRD